LKKSTIIAVVVLLYAAYYYLGMTNIIIVVVLILAGYFFWMWKEKKDTDALVAKYSDKEQTLAYLKGNITLGMHIAVVALLKGEKYEEKKQVSKASNKVTYSYGRYTNKKNNFSYKLKVTYEDDRVIKFTEL